MERVIVNIDGYKTMAVLQLNQFDKISDFAKYSNKYNCYVNKVSIILLVSLKIDIIYMCHVQCFSSMGAGFNLVSPRVSHAMNVLPSSACVTRDILPCRCGRACWPTLSCLSSCVTCNECSPLLCLCHT